MQLAGIRKFSSQRCFPLAAHFSYFFSSHCYTAVLVALIQMFKLEAYSTQHMQLIMPSTG